LLKRQKQNKTKQLIIKQTYAIDERSTNKQKKTKQKT